MSDHDIIQLDDGYQNVKRDGIDPFISFIENGEREFFKAKEFVKLYDLIFKMYHHHLTTSHHTLTSRPLHYSAADETLPVLCIARVCRCIQRDPYNWSEAMYEPPPSPSMLPGRPLLSAAHPLPVLLHSAVRYCCCCVCWWC